MLWRVPFLVRSSLYSMSRLLRVVPPSLTFLFPYCRYVVGFVFRFLFCLTFSLFFDFGVFYTHTQSYSRLCIILLDTLILTLPSSLSSLYLIINSFSPFLAILVSHSRFMLSKYCISLLSEFLSSLHLLLLSSINMRCCYKELDFCPIVMNYFNFDYLCH